MKCENKTTKESFLELNKIYPYVRREDSFKEEENGMV